jgi:hypothetical protein
MAAARFWFAAPDPWVAVAVAVVPATVMCGREARFRSANPASSRRPSTSA